MSKSTDFMRDGWLMFETDPAIKAWAGAAHQAGRAALQDPANAPWHQCEGTWFIGVDALPNDADGQLPGGPPLMGASVDFVRRTYGALPPLHRAQISSVFPGYPRARPGEGAAALRYRIKRDAAHVDGVKMIGDTRRRSVDEPHAWVLGVPLTHASADAAPLVVWEGSHVIMQRAFETVLRPRPVAEWRSTDITEAYQAARKEVFETCKRVCVHAQPGQSYVMHRLTLHGVAPWGEGATAPQEGRMIAYFRPEVRDDRAWLAAN